ncbi:MAG: ABC transporter permease [Candidatus Faecalibacterium intestinavium]|uniref:ABC transporter permease n=1 Tax=Candidatus Faecalibacterium intestinavium TaxID=2838580 RepID=A0A9E2KL92_9FIRM|nr:ABC transporter permease [Candidatus Faecalibacterium intestinavium]
MLGIIIGVTAVIVIVGLGTGMTNSVRESFASMGINSMTVSVWGRGTSRNATVDDFYRIVEENPVWLEAASPEIYMNGTVKVATESYNYTNVKGVNEEYLGMKSCRVAQGRGIQYMDIQENKNVCVIGAYLARIAFNGNAVGETIKVGANKFRIVGVLAPKVEQEDMQEGSEDDCVYVPYSTAMRLSAMSIPNSYVVTMTDENYATQAKAALEEGLYAIYNDENAYYVYSMSEQLEVMNETISMVIIVLTLIASISLLVGGIGIMNIMLVSVTERTREIGIRKALGAREGAILLQFVMEAATTSALGGVLGIVMGYILAAAINKIMPLIMEVDSYVTPTIGSVVVAFGISVGIGVFFGYLPARRAARLNPIDALRYD